MSTLPSSPPQTIVTPGEVLLRLSVPPGQNLRNLPLLYARSAGAEANLAAGFLPVCCAKARSWPPSR